MTPAEVEEIEQRVDRVLATVPEWIWDGETLPVPVEHIADSHFGLLVRDADDVGLAPGAPELGRGEALSGLLLADRGEVWVSAGEARAWPPRRRFTIGHELGHWCLHRRGREHVYCRDSVVDSEGEPPELPLPERQANAFAAALLMPPRLMRRRYALNRDFHDLCRTFDVSSKAMSRRLPAVIPRSVRASR